MSTRKPRKSSSKAILHSSVVSNLPDFIADFPIDGLNEPKPLKLLCTKKESAYALGISKRSVDYYIAAKKLETRRIGRRRLVTAASLRKFAKSDHFESVAA